MPEPTTAQPVNLADVEALALKALDRNAADYFAGGAEDEHSLRENRRVWNTFEFRPHTLVDVEARSTATTVLGTEISLPVLVAPTGFQRVAHPDGELATARAAAEAGTIMVLSTFSTTSLEEVQETGEAPRWFQLYVHKDRGLTEGLVQRAEAAGYEALVLTVDVPVLGRREKDLRNGFTLPPELRLANFDLDQMAGLHGAEGDSGLAAFHRGVRDSSFTWKDVDWLASITNLPILLKGILRGDDARQGMEHGVQGIIASNHGGRQLDGALPALRAVPEIVDAVEDRIEVLVDGGVRRGTDVAKALALGARAVLIGRPVVWGLAWDGQAGVARVLEMLHDEFDTTMALLGAPTVADLTTDLLA